LIAEDVPYVFLVSPEALPVVHKKFQNVKQMPGGLTYNFIKWYIPKEWQKVEFGS
jgi:peptide/nickel transport system substrate-binding protein